MSINGNKFKCSHQKIIKALCTYVPQSDILCPTQTVEVCTSTKLLCDNVATIYVSAVYLGSTSVLCQAEITPPISRKAKEENQLSDSRLASR